jgi:hypothetical protein
MDYARAVRRAQQSEREDTEKKKNIGQCAFMSHYGQCGLRGSTGNAGPKGDRWCCAFHNRILCRTHDGDVPIQNNIDGLRRVIRIEREQGATRWDHRTLEEWWERADGTIQPTPPPEGCKNIPGEYGPNNGEMPIIGMA